MKELTNLKALHTVDLTDTKVTGAGISAVAASPSLRVLKISKQQITDDTILGLLKTNRLHLYSLARNDDAKPAATTAEIARLFLMDTPVTDETLRALTALKSLKILNVRGTKVTAHGIEELKKALPGIKIIAR